MNEELTKNCIVCGKTAVSWSGHVHRENEKYSMAIVSGWCKFHSPRVYNHPTSPIEPCINHLGMTGCHGKYKKKYGVIVE